MAASLLGHLDEAELKLHAGAIVGLLADGNERVRCSAVETLGMLDKAALSLHAGAIKKVLADSDECVCDSDTAALLRKLDPVAHH
jgi:hypothetical protein